MYQLKALALAILTALAATSGLATTAHSVDEMNIAPGRTLKGPGVALHGYDPVAFFVKGAPAVGSAKYSVAHKGATYRFISQSHLDMFKAGPAKYIPAYGGFCAYGVAVGAKFDGDPRYWKVVDGKLYLNLNQEIQKTWFEDIGGNISKAEENWPRIKSQDPEALG